MALLSNATELANLFDPQVVADLVDAKLVDYIKFSPLAVVDTTLVNNAGDTVTLPQYAYIGDAADVPEGTDIPIGQLVETTTDVKVKKIGKGVQLTDEAVLSGHGDPMNQASEQILIALGSKEDNDMLTVLEGIGAGMTHTATGTSLVSDDIADALAIKFGEDMDGDKVLLVSPEQYNDFRKNNNDWIPASEVAANVAMSGTVGFVQGCQVVVSNKLRGKKEAFIVKPGALKIFLKRGVLVEMDRDIINKSTIITADKHGVCYLYDSSKAIKITHA